VATVFVGISLFLVFIVALELLTGCALVGFDGDNMVVEREKSPGPYWFAILVHATIGIGIPLLFWLGA